MTWSPKHVMFIALLVGLAATALVSELALNWYPPTWQTPTGQWGYFAPAQPGRLNTASQHTVRFPVASGEAFTPQSRLIAQCQTCF